MQDANFGNIASGFNSYLNALENFNPNNVDDIWRWIPQGLVYDLVDVANDNRTTNVWPNEKNLVGVSPFFCSNAKCISFE